MYIGTDKIEDFILEMLMWIFIISMVLLAIAGAVKAWQWVLQ